MLRNIVRRGAGAFASAEDKNRAGRGVRHIEYNRGAQFGITAAANVFGVASTPRVTVQATHVAVVRSHLSWSHLLFPAA